MLAAFFTTSELIGGWEALRLWIALGVQPSAGDVQNTCLVAASQGFPGPCRINPSYVIGDFDDRIPPR